MYRDPMWVLSLAAIAVAAEVLTATKLHADDQAISEVETGKLCLHCMVLRLGSDFGERVGLDLEAGPAELSDIETYFLFPFPKGHRSTPVEFSAGETIRLSNTFETPHADEWTQVSGTWSGDKIRLKVSWPKESTIRLPRDLVAEIPKGGSVFIQTETSLPEDRRIYVWVMDATKRDK